MDEILKQLANDPMGRMLLHFSLSGGISHLQVCLLVVSRLTGLFVIAPLMTKNILPFSLRCGLVLALSLIITPTLSDKPIEANLIELTSLNSTDPIKPTFGTMLICLAGSEIGLGTLLGLSLIAICHGIRLSGEWIERHSGLGQGSLLDPDWSSGTSPCSSLVALLAVASLLLMDPIGGHLQILQVIMESFRSIPVGSFDWSSSVIQLLGSVVQQSLILGLRVCLPIVTLMMLLDFLFAFASRQGSSVLGSSQAILRVSAGAFVLAFMLTGIPEVIGAVLASSLQLVSRVH